MTGTVKQMKWAEDIMSSAFEALDTMERNFNRSLERGVCIRTYDLADISEARKALEAGFKTFPTAGDLIDSRIHFAPEAIRQTVERYHAHKNVVK